MQVSRYGPLHALREVGLFTFKIVFDAEILSESGDLSGSRLSQTYIVPLAYVHAKPRSGLGDCFGTYAARVRI